MSIPRTIHNLDPWECLSAMQKSIRRSMEREAMEFACELMHTSKSYFTMTCNRLLVCSFEDIDALAAPHVVPFVACAIEQAQRWFNPAKVGKSRLAVGSAILVMCAAPKSRRADHFSAAIGLASELEGFVPTIPDHAYDQHTSKGRAMGRGLRHFREHGAKLVPPPSERDPFETEAYRLWALKQRSKVKPDLFGNE